MSSGRTLLSIGVTRLCWALQIAQIPQINSSGAEPLIAPVRFPNVKSAKSVESADGYVASCDLVDRYPLVSLPVLLQFPESPDNHIATNRT